MSAWDLLYLSGLVVGLVAHAITFVVACILLWALTMDAWDARRRR